MGYGVSVETLGQARPDLSSDLIADEDLAGARIQHDEPV